MNELKSALQRRVAAQLIAHLRDNDFAAGDRVNEGECARVLGVSRTPVRSALQYLVSEKILEAKRNKGFFVIRIPDAADRILSEADEDEDELYDKILADLLTGRLPKTTSLDRIRKHFGVERQAVAAAIRRLNREGLVQPAAGRGWTFVDVDARALVAGLQLRLMIEPQMIMLPEFEFRSGHFDQLYEEHLRLEAMESLDEEWPNAFEQDVLFHETLGRCSNNDFVLEVIQRQNIIRRITEYVGFMGHQRLRESIGEHIEVIEALRVDDREWAAAVLRRHLKRAMAHYDAHLHGDIDDLGAGRGRSDRQS